MEAGCGRTAGMCTEGEPRALVRLVDVDVEARCGVVWCGMVGLGLEAPEPAQVGAVRGKAQ